jgi:hypothetical protein
MPIVAIRHCRLAERLRKAECPKCNHSVSCAESEGRFDAEGFESYQIDCAHCRMRRVGVVDPADDALLLSRDSIS